MRAISRRLERLEKAFAPSVDPENAWGGMARLRDELLRRAEEHGPATVAQLKQELDAFGPLGLLERRYASLAVAIQAS